MKCWSMSWRRPSKRSSSVASPLRALEDVGFSISDHGQRRRSALSASRRRVSSFSRASSCLRAASHSSRDLTRAGSSRSSWRELRDSGGKDTAARRNSSLPAEHRISLMRRRLAAGGQRLPVRPRRRRIPGVLGPCRDGAGTRGSRSTPPAGAAGARARRGSPCGRGRPRRAPRPPLSTTCSEQQRVARPSSWTSTSLTWRNIDGPSLATSRWATTRPASVRGSSSRGVVNVRTSGRESIARSSGNSCRASNGLTSVEGTRFSDRAPTGRLVCAVAPSAPPRVS